MKRGQAMLETVIAVFAVSLLFFLLFSLSQMLTRKILLEHAAMRVARARTVGLNDFMCEKAARVAMIPVSGRRLWPEGDELDWNMEIARVPDYLYSEDGARARGVLEYEKWSELKVSPGDGRDSRVTFENLEGRAGIESNASFYMTDMGL